MSFHHVTVLKNEMIENLLIKRHGIYVDMTLGGGGHTEEILKSGGAVIGIDRDENAIKAASERLKEKYNDFTAVKSNFSDVRQVLESMGINGVDGILMDLGVSSHQLDEAKRGFSYMKDAPLDMRMDTSEHKTARDIVNNYSLKKLKDIIEDYGEERWAKRIAEFIVNAREQKQIETTCELVEIIKAAVPKGARKDGPHPAKRTFQAIRIAVNGELEILENAVINAQECLNPGGRMGIITFHSLEDRIVKNTFAKLAKGCVCPRDFPVCVCKGRQKVKILTRKPILPGETELEQNPRARSAKLRVIEKLGR
jgi:16S rRNA (cytosine1402-N4)-methyltransferase